jgi:hypothetical protein
LLSCKGIEGMGPSLAVDVVTDAAVFEAYLERILSPALGPSQVVVMDHLAAQKDDRVRELIEGKAASFYTYRPTHQI